MFLTAVRLLPIKDLKALRFFSSAGYYRHAGPKGPEEMFFMGARFPKVGREPVPRRAIGYTSDCGGQAPALRVGKGFSSCAVLPGWRASPNYRLAFGFCVDRAIAGDRPPRYVPL